MSQMRGRDLIVFAVNLEFCSFWAHPVQLDDTQLIMLLSVVATDRRAKLLPIE